MLYYAQERKTSLSMEEAKEGIEVGPLDYEEFMMMAEVGEG